MKVADIINRLKDTRGFINERKIYEEDGECDEDELSNMEFMLEGVESAIEFFEEWLLTNEDFED
jgi:hypothetical protein